MKLTALKKFLLRKQIADYAKSLGFDLVGFSPAKIEEKYLKGFEEWLAKGHHGTMQYMEKIEQRRDISRILPGAKSVVVLAMNYYHEQRPLPRGYGRIARYAYGRDYHKVIGKKLKKLEKFIQELTTALPHPQSSPPLAPSKDLPPHMPTSQICPANVMTNSSGASHKPSSLDCHANCPTDSTNNHIPPDISTSQICTHDGRTNLRSTTNTPHLLQAGSPATPLTKSYVDTGPILERALAEQSGLGRIGKNGCLITKKLGSWVFLSEIITTLDLNSPAPKSARADFDAQKTANQGHSSFKKISQGKLSASATPDRWSDHTQKSFNVCGNCTRCMTACPTGAIIAPGVVDSRLYGCDICQEVCPHNEARQKINTHPELINPKIAGDQLNLKELLAKNSPLSSDTAFLETFAGSPVMRAKRKGLIRNAKALK